MALLGSPSERGAADACRGRCRAHASRAPLSQSPRSNSRSRTRAPSGSCRSRSACTALALGAFAAGVAGRGIWSSVSLDARYAGAAFRLVGSGVARAARTMLSAEVAEIVVFSHSAEEGALRSIVSPPRFAHGADRARRDPLAALRTSRPRGSGALAAYTASSRARRVARRGGPGRCDRRRVRGAERIFGIVLVGNRLGTIHDLLRTTEGSSRRSQATPPRCSRTTVSRAGLRHQAFHDSLTGLRPAALRRSGAGPDSHRRWPAAPAGAVHRPRRLQGHQRQPRPQCGNQLLIAVAERVRASLRPDDLVARLGGDEFAVLLERSSRSDAEAVATSSWTRFAHRSSSKDVR